MDNEPRATILDRFSTRYRIQAFKPARWEEADLQHVLEGVEDLAMLMGGPTRFQSEMLAGIRAVYITRSTRDASAAAMALPVVDVLFFKRASWGNPPELKWQTVHELAHVWDMRRVFRLSRGLKRATGGTDRFVWRLPIPFKYEPGGRWLKGRPPPLNAREDWADSVATYVYEGYAAQCKRMISPVRWNYVGQRMRVKLPYPVHWIPHFYGPEGLGPAPM